MPITLGCPSCGKRFRARDESAGKRVKCPYCGAAVSVPTAEEAGAQVTPSPPRSGPIKPPPAPTPDSGVIPTESRPEPTTPPPAGSAAIPDEWGVESPSPQRAEPNPFLAVSPPPPPPPMPVPARGSRTPSPIDRPATPRGNPRAVGETGGAPKSPEQIAAPGWRKTRAGLCWVLFGLFWLAIPGFVGFGKMVYTQIPPDVANIGGELPKGEGWIEIPGYVNDPNAVGAVRMTKMEQLDVALYAFPVILAGLCLTFGRLTCGAAPRNSGAKEMFLWSGVFTLAALVGLVMAAASHQDRLNFPITYYYAGIGFLVAGGLAEFWFLTGLASSGLALKRPKAARAVGVVGFVFALAALVPTVGWPLYYQELRPKGADLTFYWKMYEQAAVMIGWLLVIGVYWRAVRTVRLAIREFLAKAAA